MNGTSLSSLEAKPHPVRTRYVILVVLLAVAAFAGFKFLSATESESSSNPSGTSGTGEVTKTDSIPAAPAYDWKGEFDRKLAHITNGDTSGLWPVKTDYPLDGALLPHKRILAFYGNLYSKQMGILGELPPDEMLKKLQAEVAAWQAADSVLEVVPALHYIAVTAQQSPGKGNKYRLRMPFHQIDSVINMAKKIDALVFVDIQVGHSTLQEEVPELAEYLKLPNMHLGIDPEFSMKGGQAPGKVVGTFDADDINYVTEYLAKIVRENNLPPKVLVVHRFTKNMVTNYKKIKTRPEVQIVMDMDGWGGPPLKYSTYKQFIYREPVEFTGFKLFYKNDLRGNGRLLTPKEVLALKPQPVYIQYQ